MSGDDSCGDVDAGEVIMMILTDYNDPREVVTESVATKSIWSKRFSFNPGEKSRQLDQVKECFGIPFLCVFVGSTIQGYPLDNRSSPC